MNRYTGVFALVTLGLLTSCTTGASPEPQPTPDWNVACPDTSRGTETEQFDATLECLSGDTEVPIAVSDKPMVLTLWASWCQPCRKEAPELNDFHDEIGDQVEVMGVDTQDDRDAALAFAEDFSLRFSSVFDPNGEILAQSGIRTLPATFLIDTDGVTVATFRDGDLTSADLMEATEQHFGVTP